MPSTLIGQSNVSQIDLIVGTGIAYRKCMAYLPWKGEGGKVAETVGRVQPSEERNRLTSTPPLLTTAIPLALTSNIP